MLLFIMDAPETALPSCSEKRSEGNYNERTSCNMSEMRPSVSTDCTRRLYLRWHAGEYFHNISYGSTRFGKTAPPLLAFFAAGICTGTTEPNGPTGFSHLTRHTSLLVPTVPVQVVPAGISATSGKFALAAVERPLVPGT